jgi:glutamine cyclotransferase
MIGNTLGLLAMNPRKLVLLLSFALACSLIGNAFTAMAQTTEPSVDEPIVRFAYKAESFTQPFEVINGHISIKVRINGKGSFLFVLDTGAGANVVAPEIANSLSLKKWVCHISYPG